MLFLKLVLVTVAVMSLATVFGRRNKSIRIPVEHRDTWD